MSTIAGAVVVVVDDDPSVRRGLHRLLAAAGCRVSTFASGRELLEHLPREAPSCFVLDVRMPGQSGLGLYEALIAAGYRSPVLFITGDGEIPTTPSTATRSVAVLPKPVNDYELFAAMHRLMAAGAAAAASP